MKICHVINDLSRGGAESHLYSLVKLQIEKGHDVSVLLLGKDLHNFVSLENEFTSLNLNLNRFKGPKKFNDLQQMLPRVKYTFCIPIKKGWVTAKFWEMAHYGIIPFLHPTYDEQDSLKVPDFIRVKDSQDLFNKIKFLEEKPRAYQELRDLLDGLLKDEYYNGSYLNDKIMEEMRKLYESN